MKVWIGDEEVTVPFEIDTVVDGLRLSEMELLSDVVDQDQIDGVLNGEMNLRLLRPMIWLRLRRDYPDLELAGFDLELFAPDSNNGDGTDPGKA